MLMMKQKCGTRYLGPFTLLCCALSVMGFSGPGVLPSGLRTEARRICASSHSGVILHGLHTVRMLDQAEVDKNMEVIEAGKALKVGTKVFKAIKKPSGALMALPEYARNKDAADESRSADYSNWSANQRRDKRAVIVIDTTNPSAMTDLELMVKEQQKAKGSFPGPLPVLRSGPMSARAVAEAEAAGANGVVVSFADEGARSVVEACMALSMEVIAVVADEAQLDAAVAAGCTIVAVRGGDDKDFSAGVALKEKLPSSCAAVAVIDASISGTPKEVFAAQEEKEVDGKLVYPPPPLVIEQINAVKSAKFHGAFVQGAVTDLEDRESLGFCDWLSSAALSKASTKFAKLAKDYVPGGGGSPPVKPEGLLTVLEGSVKR